MEFVAEHQTALLTIIVLAVTIISIRIYVSGTKCKALR